MEKCDIEIYLHGEHIFSIWDGTNEQVTDLVQAAAIKSGQRLDWYYFGGVPVVNCIGDKQLAKAAMEELNHDELPLQWVGDKEGGVPHPSTWKDVF